MTAHAWCRPLITRVPNAFINQVFGKYSDYMRRNIWEKASGRRFARGCRTGLRRSRQKPGQESRPVVLTDRRKRGREPAPEPLVAGKFCTSTVKRKSEDARGEAFLTQTSREQHRNYGSEY